ncbi:hypothetical protein PENSPDRAFT_693950 [Peniophora sp. CONT]|nr:hypothetical protein PENSPDRAFT_693950 [Peniophora sp. CONT]
MSGRLLTYCDNFGLDSVHTLLSPRFEDTLFWSGNPVSTTTGNLRFLCARDRDGQHIAPVDISVIGDFDVLDYTLRPGGGSNGSDAFDEAVSTAWLKCPAHVALNGRWAPQLYRLNLAIESALPSGVSADLRHGVHIPIDWQRERIRFSHRFLHKKHAAVLPRPLSPLEDDLHREWRNDGREWTPDDTEGWSFKDYKITKHFLQCAYGGKHIVCPLPVYAAARPRLPIEQSSCENQVKGGLVRVDFVLLENVLDEGRTHIFTAEITKLTVLQTPAYHPFTTRLWDGIDCGSP